MPNLFFCDTYAIMELIGGNRNYDKYSNELLITSDLNLMELYYALLRDYGKDTADKYFYEWSKLIVQIPREIIRLAMEFRLLYKKEDLSYTDCMGYVFARNKGIKFLTGDQKFKDKDYVEFAK